MAQERSSPEPSLLLPARFSSAHPDCTLAYIAMSMDEEEAYHELCAYTLTRGDLTFIHQHVVDAGTAQRAHVTTKPIGLFFALVGLYLHVEQGRTGREVQRAHMALARRPEPWPVMQLPATRGAITPIDVQAAPAGPPRDAQISRWAASVWEAYAENRETVETFLRRRGIL
jgi:hypothetical protein